MLAGGVNAAAITATASARVFGLMGWFGVESRRGVESCRGGGGTSKFVMTLAAPQAPPHSSFLHFFSLPYISRFVVPCGGPTATTSAPPADPIGPVCRYVVIPDAPAKGVDEGCFTPPTTAHPAVAAALGGPAESAQLVWTSAAASSPSSSTTPTDLPPPWLTALAADHGPLTVGALAAARAHGVPAVAVIIGGGPALSPADAGSAAAALAAVAAPYCALGAMRRGVDATQALLAAAMPRPVVAALIEREALQGAALGMLRDGG